MSKTWKYRILLIAVAVCFLFVGCAGDTTEEETVRQVYERFLNMSMDAETFDDAMDMLHYELETDFKDGLRESRDYLTHYEILTQEKINDGLYAFKIYMESEKLNPDGDEMYHFVGRINGAWKVMLALQEIPKDLWENLDVDKYIDPGPNEMIDENLLPSVG